MCVCLGAVTEPEWTGLLYVTTATLTAAELARKWDRLEWNLIFIVWELRNSLKWTSHNSTQIKGLQVTHFANFRACNLFWEAWKSSKIHSVNQIVSYRSDPTVKCLSLIRPGITATWFWPCNCRSRRLYGFCSSVTVLRAVVRAVNTKPCSSVSTVIS
jgi:hypothetical protein